MVVTITKSELPMGAEDFRSDSAFLPELDFYQQHTRLTKELFLFDFFNLVLVIFTVHTTNIVIMYQESPMEDVLYCFKCYGSYQTKSLLELNILTQHITIMSSLKTGVLNLRSGVPVPSNAVTKEPRR